MPVTSPVKPLRGKRILFVDDELHYIEALLFKAEAAGLEVITCRDASRAIKIASSTPLACVVMDVMLDPGDDLPETDPQRAGIAAIDLIRRSAPHLPILCLSVLADQKEIDRLKKLGVIFLRKAETSLERTWKLIEAKITGVYSV